MCPCYSSGAVTMRDQGSVTGGWIGGSLNSKSRPTKHQYTVSLTFDSFFTVNMHYQWWD